MRLGIGCFLLGGSLLLALLIALVAAYLPLGVVLFALPIGGLLLGTGLILRNTQPWWAKLLALSPILGPVLLVLAMYLLPPRANHLVFLIPVGVRGPVILSKAERGELAERVDGHVLVQLAPKHFYSPPELMNDLVASDLAEAEYYVIDARGQRLYQLPQLTEQAFTTASQQATPAPLNPRQVGVFGTEAVQQLPALADKSLAGYVQELWTNPYRKVGQLRFTIACYDSLQWQAQHPYN